MILKLEMKHQGEELYNFHINDPVMTLTYFTARSTKVAYAFEWWKIVKNLRRKWANGLKSYHSEKKRTTGAGLTLSRGNIHVYHHNI